MNIPLDFTESQHWSAALEDRRQIHDRPAVYALLHTQEFGRLVGQSAILYVGSTGQLGGSSDSSRLRIYRYPNGRHANELRRKTKLLIDAGIEVILHWKYCGSQGEALEEETRLLANYLDEHQELPPFNANSPRVTLARISTSQALPDSLTKTAP